MVVANADNTATEATVSVTGIPSVPPPAGGQGFTISRTYYPIDGTPIDTSTPSTQNDRFVVVLTVTADRARFRPVRGGRSAAGRVRDRKPRPRGVRRHRRSLLADGRQSGPRGSAHRSLHGRASTTPRRRRASRRPIWSGRCRRARSPCPAQRSRTCTVRNPRAPIPTPARVTIGLAGG